MVMKSLKALSRSTKDAFWNVVHDCLVDLGAVPPAEARTLCTDRRAAVEFVPKHLRSNVYYHREPFEVASDLACAFHGPGNYHFPDCSDPAAASQYDVILKRHGLS